MMEIPIVDREDDTRAAVLDFAEKLAAWTNQASHRNAKGMLGAPQRK
jgi:hypothetical protein